MPSSIRPPIDVQEGFERWRKWAESHADPATVADAFLALIEAYQAEIIRCSDGRMDQVGALHQLGWSYDDIASAFNLSKSRAWQILNPKEAE